MMRALLLMTAIAAGALVLGGCASQDAGAPGAKPVVAQAAPAATSQQKGQQMVCTSGAPVGSHIAQTNCVTAAQYKEQQEQNAKSREALQNKEQQAPSPALGGGR